VASTAGLPIAHYLAAAGALLAIPLTWRWKLQTGAALDLTPSMHWPTPIVAEDLEERAGPVMVLVEYHIALKDRRPFLDALERVAAQRRRDGAFAWGVFEDAAEPARFVETFLVESWLEHLRQHERVTKADHLMQERVHRFLLQPEKITHLISAEQDRKSTKKTGDQPKAP